MTFYLSCLYIGVLSISRSAKAEVDGIKLAAVTSLSEVNDVFEVSKIEHSFEPDTIENTEIRRQICLSITKNAYFDLYAREDPVEDMTAILDVLRADAAGPKYDHPYFQRMLHDYVMKDGHWIFTYRHRITYAGERRDFTFPCLTKIRHSGRHYLYLVSDPYNLNTKSDVSTSEPFQVRFIYAPLRNHCVPLILVEEPAIAMAPPEYSREVLENIYLEIRENRNEALTIKQDPLCRLSNSKLLRVCASVMNSSYFADKVRFNPDPYEFTGECNLNEVSFLTAKTAKANSKDRPYKEWMLGCLVSPIGDPLQKLEYYLSRAYQSHHALVYRYDEKGGWRIDNISGRISMIIDDHNVGTEEERKVATSNLIDLLNKYRLPTDEEISSKNIFTQIPAQSSILSH